MSIVNVTCVYLSHFVFFSHPWGHATAPGCGGSPGAATVTAVQELSGLLEKRVTGLSSPGEVVPVTLRGLAASLLAVHRKSKFCCEQGLEPQQQSGGLSSNQSSNRNKSELGKKPQSEEFTHFLSLCTKLWSWNFPKFTT